MLAIKSAVKKGLFVSTMQITNEFSKSTSGKNHQFLRQLSTNNFKSTNNWIVLFLITPKLINIYLGLNHYFIRLVVYGILVLDVLFLYIFISFYVLTMPELTKG